VIKRRNPYLLVFPESVFLPEIGFRFLVLMGKVSLPTGTEVDVPAPEPAEERFRILVVLCSKFAVFAGVLCHID
jgi:hypothetical protein